jgi:hypothetical protein
MDPESVKSDVGSLKLGSSKVEVRSGSVKEVRSWKLEVGSWKWSSWKLEVVKLESGETGTVKTQVRGLHCPLPDFPLPDFPLSDFPLPDFPLPELPTSRTSHFPNFPLPELPTSRTSHFPTSPLPSNFHFELPTSHFLTSDFTRQTSNFLLVFHQGISPRRLPPCSLNRRR